LNSNTRIGNPTFTIPATKAPQLNAPISFGTEMNLPKQGEIKITHFRAVGKKYYEVLISHQTG
jgi:hypothetical protein